MASKKQKKSPKAKSTSGAKPAARTAGTKPAVSPTGLPYEAGISPGAVDVTGIVPEGVHVDPELTEGHPGYEESGGSEIVPPSS